MSHNSDSLVNIALFGIHHPTNFHSFSATHQIFVPKLCIHCAKFVIPLVSSCVCLRCNSYAHRACISKAPKCQYFTFSGWECSVDSSVDEVIGSELNDIGEQACMIVKVLGYMPEPGSELCVWRSILRAVAFRQSNMSRSLSIDSSTADLQDIVRSVFQDQLSFPAQVAHVAVTVYIALIKLDDFSGIVLMHARECLDSIICAFLSICNPEVVKDGIVISELCNHIDRYSLDMNFGILYNKIFRAVSSYGERVETQSVLDGEEALANTFSLNCDDFMFFDQHALEICSVRTAHDKVHKLVIFLQCIVTRLSSIRVRNKTGINELIVEAVPPIVASCAEYSENNCAAKDERDESKTACDEVSLQTKSDIIKYSDAAPIAIPPHELSEQTVNSDLLLLPLGSQDVLSPIKSEHYPIIDTDQLIQVFILVISRQIHDKVVDWAAECCYMTSVLLRDQDHLIGAEGYALTTIQQCIDYIFGQRFASTTDSSKRSLS
jgi:hypothetical protein